MKPPRDKFLMGSMPRGINAPMIKAPGTNPLPETTNDIVWLTLISYNTKFVTSHFIQLICKMNNI